jgi:hypothetical protein
LRAIHRSFGAVKPVSERLPVASTSAESPPSRSSISAASVAVRWSFHSSAGRSTESDESRATSPCICPLRPMPPSSPTAELRVASTFSDACHHSSGSCSVQPGRGVSNG